MTLIHADCVEAMAGMDPESVDAIVTDPPYNLTGGDSLALGSGGERTGLRPKGRTSGQRQPGGFMGKAWDGTGIAFRRETWEAAFRVAKPSAYLLAFGGTRTVHRMTCALEDAGWIIRDMLVWGYASGFPKSRASLKPAWEPIVMARKPGPLRTLAIDACRIEAAGPKGEGGRLRGATGSTSAFNGGNHAPVDDTLGRWPANIVLTDPIFDGGIAGVVGGGEARSAGEYPVAEGWTGKGYGGEFTQGPLYSDTGSYSRFFILPKADRADREPVLGGLPLQTAHLTLNGQPTGAGPVTRANVHPTVKPTDLMRHLVRLVTPTGGTVLDCFAGSGSTLLAAELEGFPWIGIEREAEYVAIAEARLIGTQRGLGLGA